MATQQEHPQHHKNNNPADVQHELPPGRDDFTPDVEPEEPAGRASPGATPEGMKPKNDQERDIAFAPPREESRERDSEISPNRPRRTTM